MDHLVPQDRLLDFRDLQDRKIVPNRATLSRWIENKEFPPGFLIGDNTRRWHPQEVEEWLASRRLHSPQRSPQQEKALAKRRARRALPDVA